MNSRVTDFWTDLPDHAKGVFRTDGFNSPDWHRIQAHDPVDSFRLYDFGDLGKMIEFFREHKDRLVAGYISYDLGLQLQQFKSRHEPADALASFHAYEGYSRIEPPKSYPQKKSEQLQFETSIQANVYQQSIYKILEYIRAGDFYQLNYTQRLTAKTETSARNLYANLIQRHPAAYASYFEDDSLVVHSLSPELFLHHINGILTTEPIKGTRPRGNTYEEDEIQKSKLLASEKEQAELYMITDLLRNDLGKVCEIGTIHLESIKGVHRLPRVWHTFSRISGKLSSDYSAFEALLSMLPGGSISGCPKRRALEVIDELETSSRGIYTGHIGYILPGGEFSFNVAIRTLVQTGNQLSLGSGGGITIDSHWKDEWEELLVKASTFC